MSEECTLEYVSGSSRKFWRAQVDGDTFTVWYGRIGTTGQTQTKRAENAQALYDTAVKGKLTKGYVYKGAAAAAAPATPAARRISVPEVRPMLATEISPNDLPKYNADPRYVTQQKLDGHRICIEVAGGDIRVLGRGGQKSQHTPLFTSPAYAAVRRLVDCVIDGELVDGVLWIFDLPVCAGLGISLTSPYADRLAALEGLFVAWAPSAQYQLVPTARSHEEKALLAISCLKSGAEGVIIKDLQGTYEPGKGTTGTLKAKFVKTADVIVTAVGAKGKENYTLSVYRDGALTEIGRCSAIGKARVEVGTVIEVRFLYVGAGNRLYQPRMIGVRTDKTAIECTWDQFPLSGTKEVLP